MPAAKRPTGPRRGGGGSGDDPGEQLSGSGWKTAIIEGATFSAKAVQYSVVDGLAIFEGDIVLGTVAEVELRTQMQREVSGGLLEQSVIVTGANRRWTNCQVPYDIDGSLPDQARVTDAIAHWHANTRFRFVLRTPQNAGQFPDWVTFRAGSSCSSSVGRRGGQQFVNLGSGCVTGNAIHEIGHTIGLWHEQSRADRDLFVIIHWDKIQAGMGNNFDQHVTDGDDVGPYDYGSIMHYPRDAFSKDGTDTITPINPPTAQIGQRTALSAGDIAAANSLCPTRTTIKEAPKDPLIEPTVTLKEARQDPLTIKEAPKDPLIEPAVTLKEARQDLPTVKEAPKDPIRDTFKEIRGDPKGPADPPGGTFAEQVGPVVGPQQVGPFAGPAFGPRPFAMATGHQAPALGGGGVDNPSAEIAALDAALQQSAQAIVEADANQIVLQQQFAELEAALAAAVQAAGGGLA